MRSLCIDSSELGGEGVSANSASATDSCKITQNTPAAVKKNSAGSLMFQHEDPLISC